MKKMKILICRILKVVHYRVYKCIAILHTPMGRTHGESSMSKLDNDAKRVANIYMELPQGHSIADVPLFKTLHPGVYNGKVISPIITFC